ncbi:MAG: P-loop NTPase [Calditrichaeota bacterium]|nr:P-loop NTPase [Calditrichota bacterium]
MAEVTQEQIIALLRQIQYPGQAHDIVSYGIIKDISIQNTRVTVTLKFPTQDPGIKGQIKSAVEQVLREALPDNKIMVIESIPILTTGGQKAPGAAPDPWADRARIPGVARVLAVASGKGGVGKSTVSTNLAIALAQTGLQVGLMDSDIYGPSIHIMMGIDQKPRVSPEEKLLPIEKYGIRMMSMGFLVDREAPLIWRGPIVTKAVQQFLRDVDWGQLDILVIDLPPGTGDIQLTLVQKTPLDGAIVVTTPQEVAVVDARRGYRMFEKVQTPVYGIVENMSYFVCDQCGSKHYIFGKGGGAQAAKALGVPFLGEIPIEAAVTEAGDAGAPVVIRNPESPSAVAFKHIANQLIQSRLFQ